MFTAQGSTQDPSSFVPITLMIVVGTLIFWRTMIKVVAISVILLAILGLSDLLQNLHLAASSAAPTDGRMPDASSASSQAGCRSEAGGAGRMLDRDKKFLPLAIGKRNSAARISGVADHDRPLHARYLNTLTICHGIAGFAPGPIIRKIVYF